ncbi:MATE family efflux transporter [Natronorubrum daqingense]|uniref:MATE family efflux transporter n=1 Tax=Natronorubrum daqingense TaxID=588898 RepID=A0A1N6XW12_9EURY|nr:MATE family efflux transporter [Natronorubrum daqingense]APX95848.1 MATE family efflux transporter [Natronorubrum daqingense]SIR06550.1 putative efflux protein, MATE family [Natronorubrum daqingense]
MTATGEDRSVDVTDGELLKPIVFLAIPLIVTQLLQVAYNIADTFWVGRVSADAVAAISFAFPIIFLIISIGGGFTVAGTILIAQHKGADNHEEVDHVVGQTMSFVLLVSIVASIIGYIFTPQLLTLVGADAGSAVHEMAVSYTRTWFLGTVTVFAFFMFQALLRGWGDTRTPMYLMAISVVLNIVLDPFLILGFEDNPVFSVVGLESLEATLYSMTGFTGLDVQGAAIATVISRAVGAAVGIWLLVSGQLGIRPTLSQFRLQLETVKTIVRLGIPAGIEQSTRALGLAVLTALVAIAGSDAVAAYGVGGRVYAVFTLLSLGVAQATEVVVGQNLGADQTGRARRGVLLNAGIIGGAFAAMSVAVYAFAPEIIEIFLTEDESGQVVQMGADFLMIVGPTFAFLGVFQILMGAFRGSGSTRIAMAFSILSLWIIQIPVALALIEWAGIGETGVWYAMALSNVVSVLVAGLWFLRGTWTDDVVSGRPSAAE